MRLERTTAIVTGGASGVGAAVVRRFVAEGAQVRCTDIDKPSGSALEGELGGAATFVAVDVKDEAEEASLCTGTIMSVDGGFVAQ